MYKTAKSNTTINNQSSDVSFQKLENICLSFNLMFLTTPFRSFAGSFQPDQAAFSCAVVSFSVFANNFLPGAALLLVVSWHCLCFCSCHKKNGAYRVYRETKHFLYLAARCCFSLRRFRQLCNFRAYGTRIDPDVIGSVLFFHFV